MPIRQEMTASKSPMKITMSCYTVYISLYKLKRLFVNLDHEITSAILTLRLYQHAESIRSFLGVRVWWIYDSLHW